MGAREYSKFPLVLSLQTNKALNCISSTSHNLNHSDLSHMLTRNDVNCSSVWRVNFIIRMAAIRVLGLPPDYDQEMVTMYFESKRKSGGGRVEEVQFEEDTGAFLVTFGDINGNT